MSVNNFNIELYNKFKSFEKDYEKPKIKDVLDIYKKCCDDLKVDDRADVENCSFMIEYFNSKLCLNFYYNIIELPNGALVDQNDSFVCEFSVTCAEELNFDECDVWGNGCMNVVFETVEKSQIYNFFKDRVAEYQVFYNKNEIE